MLNSKQIYICFLFSYSHAACGFVALILDFLRLFFPHSFRYLDGFYFAYGYFFGDCFTQTFVFEVRVRIKDTERKHGIREGKNARLCVIVNKLGIVLNHSAHFVFLNVFVYIFIFIFMFTFFLCACEKLAFKLLFYSRQTHTHRREHENRSFVSS